ncbi:cytosolic carboxypeptidase 4 [Ambystoma mexicanum]|uniref:cytosolic carboxypeptidase 4 n=1 Tax=Ambystoma mexicanum TaxID=8296 RepID=UPI0037E786BC
MAGEGGSGLQVLLNTLQNSCEKEATLNILTVLSELLSAGTDRRIHYMIAKGGSEALLQTLVNIGREPSHDYSVLLPLLRLLATVGQRDGKFGEKAQKLEATDLLLSLARTNLSKTQYLTPCLWVLQTYASSVATGAILGLSGALELLFKVICPFTRKHTQTIRAALEALAALLKSKSNCKRAVSRGYVRGLLQFYEDWHSCDTSNSYITIRRALLRCLKHITNIRSGREAFLEAKGMEVLFTSARDCACTRSLDSLVVDATQILRKCYPKCHLPLTTISSSYSFTVSAISASEAVSTPREDCPEEDGELETEKDLDRDELANQEEDDDLETDLNNLKPKLHPDRPLEELEQYEALCPELFHDFQELAPESGDEPNLEDGFSSARLGGLTPIQGTESCKNRRYLKTDQRSPNQALTKDSFEEPTENNGMYCQPASIGKRPNGKPIKATGKPVEVKDFNGSRWEETECSLTSNHMLQNSCDTKTMHRKCVNLLSSAQTVDHDSETHNIVRQLLARHPGNTPFHDPLLYMNMAAHTKSIPDYKVLAFPDFWGHCKLLHRQVMLERKCGVQRDKVFQDLKRLLEPSDLLDKVVFDLDSPSPLDHSDDIESLQFYSKFESGNLRKVIQVRPFEYDLIMNADVNTSQHHQWFYFEVSAIRAGISYRFNVINCEKDNSQFNYGMQPVMYSVKEALQGRAHWVRLGYDICYYKNPYFRTTTSSGELKGKRYYTMTFSVTFSHNEDVCYLAYHYPYTYSALTSHLHLLEQGVDHRKVFFKQQVLCSTLSGNPCPIVTITATPESKSQEHILQLRNRPYLVLTARVHPGESNASWVMKGTLEFLLSSDPAAEILRESFIFKIIPMLNPDGVINGNHRCSLIGDDLNRQWLNPSKDLHPTIYHTKGLLCYLRSIGRTPLVFCDYHGHSQKKNVFLYGCSIKETLWQAGCVVDKDVLLEDVGYRALPKILDKVAPAFSMTNSSFLVEKSRASTARVVVWREIGVLRSYTMESTYSGCNQGPYKGYQMGTRELEEMGVKFCLALLVLHKSLNFSPKLAAQVDALLDLENEAAVAGASRSMDSDDEPVFAERIDYNTDSCSDQEVDFGDSDPDIQQRGLESEDELHGDQTPSSELLDGLCLSSKTSADTASLSLPSSHIGCSPEPNTHHQEHHLDCSTTQQVGQCL